MNITVDTTKLIVEYLKEIFPDVESRRSYVPECDPNELEEIGKIILNVFPIHRKAERYTQGGKQKCTPIICIAINAKLTHRNDELEMFNAEVDEYVAFSERLYSAFLKKIVKNVGGLKVAFDQPEHDVLVDFDVIQHRNCFFGVVRVNAEVFA